MKNGREVGGNLHTMTQTVVAIPNIETHLLMKSGTAPSRNPTLTFTDGMGILTFGLSNLNGARNRKECDGMFNNYYEKFLEEEARRRRQEEKELRENPLLRYSTSQLKEELRRRKKEGV